MTGSIDVSLAEAFKSQIASIYDTTKPMQLSLYMDDGEQTIAFGWYPFSDEWDEVEVTEPLLPVRDGIAAYSCPSTDCSIIHIFNTDDILPSTGNVNGWEYIITKGVSYYVQEDDVTPF